jgi:hypothetical protein
MKSKNLNSKNDKIDPQMHEIDIDDYIEYNTGWREEDKYAAIMLERTAATKNLTDRYGIPEKELNDFIDYHNIKRIKPVPGKGIQWDRISLLDFYWIAKEFGKFPDY